MSTADPRKLARIAGWLFVATFVTSIPALLLYGPVLDHRSYIVGGGHDTQIELAAFLEILLAIANIGTAVELYPLIKRHSQTLSLGYVASRTLESTVILVGVVSMLAVVTLRHDLAGTPGADDASLVLTQRTLVAVHDWTFLLGPSFCAGFGTGIVLGTVMYRTGLVPRRLALIGVIGGPLAFLAATGTLFGVYDQNSAPQFLLTIGEIVWELSLGIYLIVRGFTASGLAALQSPPAGEVPRGVVPAVA